LFGFHVTLPASQNVHSTSKNTSQIAITSQATVSADTLFHSFCNFCLIGRRLLGVCASASANRCSASTKGNTSSTRTKSPRITNLCESRSPRPSHQQFRDDCTTLKRNQTVRARRAHPRLITVEEPFWLLAPERVQRRRSGTRRDPVAACSVVAWLKAGGNMWPIL